MRPHQYSNLLLGIDVGTSFIKVSVVEATTGQCIASTQRPDTEAEIISPQPGWAEQDPETWWQYTKEAILRLHNSNAYNPAEIKAIGISYQMHGLVVVDKAMRPLRNAIIWCDSRAVETGNEAIASIGKEYCQSCLLNSPGNFTASKLAWVKKAQPNLYNQIYKMMLPGDFIAMKLTGSITTTPSALSEGILWDFKSETLSPDVMRIFGFDDAIIPDVQPVFSRHGKITKEIAKELYLSKQVSVTYKAGDQLNNALSLNVLRPGEVAATAGTSGVIYAVTDKLFADKLSRVNAFAHVNHTVADKRLGVLLCINGTGILNKWLKSLTGEGMTYQKLNNLAASVLPGSEGLTVLPFGNGAERMLENKLPGAQVLNLDFNRHSMGHLARAVQEGIAFAFRYGLDIMHEGGINPSVIKAGKANLFLSDVFAEAFVNATGVPVELYNTDGSTGAAIGAGIGAGIYKTSADAFQNLQPLQRIEVTDASTYHEAYLHWKAALEVSLGDS